MLNSKSLICKEWIEEDLDINRGVSCAAIQPDPLETDVVFNGGFPALRNVAFWVDLWVGPALPVVVDISVVQTIAVEEAEASVCLHKCVRTKKYCAQVE
jgi:hypothetical protein